MRAPAWTKAAAISDAANYKTKIEWKTRSNSAYAAARRNGWIDEACAHMTMLRRKMGKVEVLASAAAYGSRGAWQAGDPSAHTLACRNGWLEEACAHMPAPPRLLSKDEVLASAKLFSGRTEWKDGHGAAWAQAQKGGYLEDACAHMIRLAHRPSEQEQGLFDFVVALCPDAIQSDRSVLGRKQLDILIPSKRIAIEFNGLIWHSSKVGTGREYHQAKSDAAAAAGYRLIHIWSDEWIEKQDIIKAYLRMQLVSPDRVIGARKCSIVAITPEVALPFHRMFHLQGGRGGEHFGLYHAGELLAVATVQGCELARWTVRFGTVVVGALSKMMKHIGRRIISYCDTAKHSGAGYLAAGFKQIAIAAPSYYYTEGNKRFNRVGFQKHKLLAKPGAVGNTEAELAASLGFYQVGGCRQLKFEFNNA